MASLILLLFDLDNLISAEGATFFQVRLYTRFSYNSFLRDSTLISIPYWHDENANHVLSTVSEYLRVIHRETGLYAFDPQTEQLVDLKAGLIGAESAYQFGVDAVDRIHNRNINKKPWWKIW